MIGAAAPALTIALTIAFSVTAYAATRGPTPGSNAARPGLYHLTNAGIPPEIGVVGLKPQSRLLASISANLSGTSSSSVEAFGEARFPD